jgi:zinc transport system permease protein
MTLIDVFYTGFMQKALIAGVFASIACGIIGPLVVANRMVFIAGGISHAAYGGVGLALFLGLPVFSTTLVYSFLIALIIASLTIKNISDIEMIIGLIWSAGMSLGIILMDLSPGYNADIMSYLFGSLIVVSNFDIIISVILALTVIITTGLFYNQFLVLIYDKDFAIVSGINVKLLHFIFNIMVACSIVMLIRVVGLILVIAMLTIPVYIASIFCSSFFRIIIFSVLLNILFIFSGLIFSYYFNLSTGATIIATGTISLLFVMFTRIFIKKHE